MKFENTYHARLCFGSSLILLGTTLLISVGCVQTNGARSSIWPTKSIDGSATLATPKSSITSSLTSSAKGVKGQFATMGNVVSSAYGKAKTAVSTALVPAPGGAVGDATSLATKPTNLGPEVYIIQGQMYEAQGQYTKAMDFYSKALEAESDNAGALSSLARLHDRQNNGPKAIEFYEKAIAVEPKNAPLISELASAHAKAGQLASAKNQLEKAIQIDPKNRTYRSSLAGILIDEGQAEKAEEQMKQVDEPAMANYQMAYLNMSRQNLPATRKYLNNALTIDPNLQPAREMLNSLGGNGQGIQQAQNMYQQGNQLWQQTSQLVGSVQNAYQTSPANSPSANGQTAVPNTLQPTNFVAPTSVPISH